MNTPIYLDHAASTPTDPRVLERMLPIFTERFGNPSSIHAFGRDAQAALTEARDEAAAFFGVRARQLIFTSGGTESDNLAIFGMGAAKGYRGHVITTQIEHHAVLHACQHLEQLGTEVTYLPVDQTGRVSAEAVREAIRPDTYLITVMYGNNEVGTLQPIAEIGAIAREMGIPFHTDAVQALGTEELKLEELFVDMMSFSGHKIGGPKGVGALICSEKIKLIPQLYGGLQERGKRAGTENMPGIVGFSAALELALADVPAKRRKLEHIRSRMVEELRNLLPAEAVIINGNAEHRLPQILNVSFPGVSSESMLMNLDLAGVAASSGSACTSGSLELSHVLKAMRLPEDVLRSAIRFSFAESTTEEEIFRAAQICATTVRRIRKE